MIRRILAVVPLLWGLGFVAFVLLLPRAAPAGRTDAVVVPTGGAGRIARGLSLLQAGQAKRLLITGVGRSVKAGELAAAQHVPRTLFACCVDLGRDAVDTRSNAEETADWLKARRYTSVRLVTTDWHMRRAQFELERAVGPQITIVPDAVVSSAPLSVLLREYHKYLLRWVTVRLGL